ncbi:MAG: histidinol dehydrogenase, partial [Desulfovibrionales bacterium]
VEYTSKFDCPDFNEELIPVPTREIQEGVEKIPGSDLAILQEAMENIRSFHERQKQNSWITTREDGTVLGQMVRPVDRAGLYVPGGKGGETPLISSLLMNAVPAQVAGVAEIAVASPPRKDGTLNPYILAAAHLLGIELVFRAGSAWAIAALAFGTGRIPAVDVIAGPGNIFVTTAKRLLMGRVGIDMIAGPSEILILADETADPNQIAADMLSQAEHDPQAAALCITNDENLGDQIADALKQQLDVLPRNEIAAKALTEYGAIIQVPDLEIGLELANRIAPEHFELLVRDPWPLVGKVRNAGALFLGANTPEPVGDYFAGPNHVLPTMGTARFSSALSVETFCKKTSLLAASPDYTQKHGDKIARLARLEGLEAHARSVERRKK